MTTKYPRRHNRGSAWPWTQCAIVACALILTHGVAQGFDSGSTGVDGPFAPSSNTTLTLPASGIFNFTTITIPAGVTVTFTKNTTNTPVIMLATGSVSISGTIDVRGASGAPTGTAGNGNVTDDSVPGEGGPGGFRGGAGGLGGGFGGSLGSRGGDGIGPGGGQGGSVNSGVAQGGGGGGFASTGGQYTSNNPFGAPGGAAYGTTRLLPLVGGSGGGGGGGGSGFSGSGGGGGGGALLLASSGSINFISGSSILADGGQGGSDLGTGCGGVGGDASGGAIRLIANTISGTGSLLARGGRTFGTGPSSCSYGTSGGEGAGSGGQISLEANSILFAGTSTPNYLPGSPGQVFAPGLPTLTITSIGGVMAPSAPLGSFAAPDITLPIGTTSPVTVALAATNIPVGTVISVTRFVERGAKATVNSTGLSGADDSATTATANISLSSGVTGVVQASATFTVQVASNPFPVYAEGEKVEKIRVAATFGGPSTIVLITESGKEIPYQGTLMN
jgi:hypothetical protein